MFRAALLCGTSLEIILPSMKLNSKYFDSIRVSKRGAKPKRSDTDFPPCQWKGCGKPAPYRAPMGRGREGDYFRFCIDHVREYNSAYNYFDGMSDNEVRNFQKDAIVGHRPTWKVGANAWAHGTREDGKARKGDSGGGAQDFAAWRAKQAREEAETRRRSLRPLEKKALDTMHLDAKATKEDIKAKYKELVKLHHPERRPTSSGSTAAIRAPLTSCVRSSRPITS